MQAALRMIIWLPSIQIQKMRRPTIQAQPLGYRSNLKTEGGIMPKKIYVITSGNNSVNWDNTKTVIKNQAVVFANGFQDFGAGVEEYVKCPGCNRNLPLVLFSLDHIKSQARYTQTNLGLLGPDRFLVLDGLLNHLADVRINAMGGYVRISTGSIYNPKTGIVHSSEIWKNDLRNLQFLCSICNSSKREKDWEAWGKSDNDAYPLAKHWKRR